MTLWWNKQADKDHAEIEKFLNQTRIQEAKRELWEAWKKAGIKRGDAKMLFSKIYSIEEFNFSSEEKRDAVLDAADKYTDVDSQVYEEAKNTWDKKRWAGNWTGDPELGE